MSYNAKMPKWIFASLCKHFNDVATGLGIPFYAEGLDDETSNVYQNTNLSLRVDGPVTHEGSSLDYYRVEVQGFLTGIGEVPGYTLHDYAGTVAESLRGVVPVYQIPEAPLVQVGCLDIDKKAVESVRIVNFSRVSTSSNVRQIAVVARLVLDLGAV